MDDDDIVNAVAHDNNNVHTKETKRRVVVWLIIVRKVGALSKCRRLRGVKRCLVGVSKWSASHVV